MIGVCILDGGFAVVGADYERGEDDVALLLSSIPFHHKSPFLQDSVQVHLPAVPILHFLVVELVLN